MVWTHLRLVMLTWVLSASNQYATAIPAWAWWGTRTVSLPWKTKKILQWWRMFRAYTLGLASVTISCICTLHVIRFGCKMMMMLPSTAAWCNTWSGSTFNLDVWATCRQRFQVAIMLTNHQRWQKQTCWCTTAIYKTTLWNTHLAYQCWVRHCWCF